VLLRRVLVLLLGLGMVLGQLTEQDDVLHREELAIDQRQGAGLAQGLELVCRQGVEGGFVDAVQALQTGNQLPIRFLHVPILDARTDEVLQRIAQCDRLGAVSQLLRPAF
jgi:hypothetical protein